MSGGTTEAVWKLRLIGSAALINPAGAEVRLPTRKTLLALAILLVDEKARTRQELARMVWEEREPEKARGSLRSALNALRSALPPNSIETIGEFVSLRQGVVQLDMPSGDHAADEFMPGFDSDWVIDQRIQVRRHSLVTLLATSRQFSNEKRTSEALAAAEEACRIDPLNEEAHETRVRLLKELARVGEAVAVAETFEARTAREAEIGAADKAPMELHPLAKAAEWVLERNPREALDLLASTPTQWFGVPLSQAVDVHVRILAANPAPSTAKSVVEAQNFFLQSLGGQTDAVLKTGGQSYERAMGTDDTQVAVRIAAAMAFSYLAKGRFSLAIKVGRMQEQVAASGSNQLLLEKAGFNLGVLEFHGGEPEKGAERLASKLAACQSIGSEEGAAMVRVNTVNALVQEGRLDEAAASLAFTRAYFEQTHNMRMLPWVSLGEAFVAEARGDLEASREILLRIRALGSKAAGYSVAAVAEDRLIRVSGRLGQWEEAADAWVRARCLSEHHGAVRTMWERAETQVARREMKECLGEKALQATLRKAQPSARSVGPHD